MSSNKKKNVKAPIVKNQEIDGLQKTIDALLKSGKKKEDEIILTLNKMIKERS